MEDFQGSVGGGGLDKRGDDLNYKKYVRIWS